MPNLPANSDDDDGLDVADIHATVEYVADMLGGLKRLVEGQDLRVLARLIEIAQREAEAIQRDATHR